MALREHFSNGRSLSLGSGLAFMGAAFGAQVSAWPHWITIGFGYGVGLVLVTSATALIAKSFFAPETSREPIVTVCALIPMSVQMADMKWLQQHDGVDAVAAVVMNLPSASASSGGRVDGLAASLQFISSSNSLYIEKTYWLESLSNFVDMSVGSTRHILVGLIENHQFCVFANRLELDPREPIENKNTAYRSVPRRLHFSEDLSVRIQVYSVTTGKIFDTQNFLIPHGLEIVNASRSE